MAAQTLVDCKVLQTFECLERSGNLVEGLLLGQRTETVTNIVGLAKVSEKSEAENYHTYVEKYLSGSLKICGLLINCKSDKPNTKIWNQLRSLDLLDTDNDLLVCVLTDAEKITEKDFFWLSQNSTEDPTQADVAFRSLDILSSSILVRIQTSLDLHIPASSGKITENIINSEFEKLADEINGSGSYVFGVEDGVFFSREDSIGLKKNAKASQLQDYLQAGHGNVNKGQKSERQKALPLTLYKKLECNNNVPKCAPFIQQTIGDAKCLTLHLPVDTLCLVPKEISMKDVHTLLCDSICLQLDSFRSCLLEFKQDGKFQQSKVFHFLNDDSGFFLSVVYPEGIDEENLLPLRQRLHYLFSLPADRPILRRPNKYIFKGEKIPGGYLLNPHTAINQNPLKDSQFYLVQGNYTYHHYMQDKFDDDKWGCAYRSLQTLVSWFKYQGYTDKPVPTHREIQQALVDIGDKDPNFVGSRKWIGSLEVSYCLEHLIGVTSKILSVSAGAELASKGRELAHHFTTQGTPIMIGGGVLAHTILGVNFSEVSGDVRFLILDPHYTGGEDINEIIQRGWCGWKGPEFWDQTAMYNMCLPQKPKAL